MLAKNGEGYGRFRVMIVAGGGSHGKEAGGKN